MGSPLVGAPLLPTLTRLAVPGIIGSMLQMALIVVEAIFLSRAGTLALAAVATVFPLIMLGTCSRLELSVGLLVARWRAR